MFVGPNAKIHGQPWISIVNSMDEEERYPIVHGCFHFEVLENGVFIPVLCFRTIYTNEKELTQEIINKHQDKVVKFKEAIKQKAKSFIGGGIVVDHIPPEEIDSTVVRTQGLKL